MKKLIYCAAALVIALFAGSCQRELLDPAAQGGSTVTYTVNVPEVATKAIGDAQNVNNLVYAVYRVTGEDEATAKASLTAEKFVYQDTHPVTNGKSTISLELINNQAYLVLFWAQVENTWFADDYQFGTKKVAYPANLVANDDKYSAFYGVSYISNVKGPDTKDITLHRPFAQINIAANDPQNYNVKINTASVTVANAASGFDVAKEEAIATADYSVSFAAAAMPLNEKLTVNNVTYETGVQNTGSKENDKHHYVAMNYVFAADNVNVSYVIDTDHGIVSNTITNVPVAKNYRTNIVGNLLTSDVKYNVELDQDWGPEGDDDKDYVVEVVSVASAEDLQEAINNIQAGAEGNIKLEDNIDLSALAGLISTKAEPEVPTYGLLIPNDKSLVLDLNGKTLYQEVECTAIYSMIENHGSLTIIDSKGEGKISFKDTGAGDPDFRWGSYTIFNHGNLVVNSGTIEHTGEHNTPEANVHMYCAIQQNNANAVTTINGGTISTPTYRSIRINSGSANFKGGVMDGQVWVQPFAEGIVLNIEGGSFEPNGGDGSSVFVTNDAKAVDFAVTGGFFKTKIGCSVSANLAGTVTGGTFTATAKENTPAALYTGYMFVQDGENYVLEQCPVKIGDSAYYATLTEAVAAVKEGETITILAGKTLEEGTIKLPATLKDVTFMGEEGAILKDMTIMASDGNSINYEGLTFNGITFENSRISLTGWRNGDETIKNLTVTNCVFKNLNDDTNSAPVHINKDASEAVNGFTFTNNVIDGATGGSKSGIYAQVTGEVLVSGNIINNVAFRPYVIQVTTDDNVADNFVVTNNTFSGSAAGRAQGLGSNANGTDAVNIEVTENIFKGISDSQQICYWNFNPETTTADLSHNYYDIDILANPGKIYYNSAAANVYDLVDMGVFPIYTDENKTTTFSPEVSAAKIGETEYATLQEAIEAVQEGETVVLLHDLNIETPAYGQNAINYARAINFTIDLNGKTLSANTGNSVFRYNITQAGATDDVTVTLKNGTITAGGNTWCVVMAAGLSEDVRAVFNLENLTINASKAGDLAVKAWDYALINAKDVTVKATKGAGGFYAVGGEIVLDNCLVDQKGLNTEPYLSMAVAVSNGGKATVNSGTYTAVPTDVSEGYNQGTTHGSWCAGVMNSGGELIIEGGIFANGNYGDDALATAARGLIFGDTASKIVINGGTFNALKSIIDYQNNLGVQPNPNIVINGGNFSADPSVVTSYGGVVIKEGFTTIKGADGRWTLVESINDEAALKAAFTNGGNVVLGANIVLSETLILPEGQTAVLNLNGKTLSHKNEETAYAINNHGNLTITGNGTVNSRGIYNGYDANENYVATAKLTIENGTFNAKGTNGGACVYNYGTVAINGGNFESVGGYGLNNQSGAVMTLKNASVRGGIYVSGATLKVENSTVYQHISGRHAIYNFSGNITVESGSFDSKSGNELILADGTNASVVLNGGTYNKTAKSWLLGAATNKNISFVINGGTYNGYVNLPENTVDTIRPYGDPIVVKGGVFNFNPTQWLAEGYEAVNNASGWMVQQK